MSVQSFNSIFPSNSVYYNAQAFANIANNAIVFNFRNYSSEEMSNIGIADTITLIHELLHLAGGGSSHTNIAKAMFNVSKARGDTPISITNQNPKINNGKPVTLTEPANDKNSKGFDKDSLNSTYINKWIETYCF